MYRLRGYRVSFERKKKRDYFFRDRRGASVCRRKQRGIVRILEGECFYFAARKSASYPPRGGWNLSSAVSPMIDVFMSVRIHSLCGVSLTSKYPLSRRSLAPTLLRGIKYTHTSTKHLSLSQDFITPLYVNRSFAVMDA